MVGRVFRRRHRSDRAAFGTDDANALDLIAAHCHKRRLFVFAEATGTKIGDDSGSDSGLSPIVGQA